LASSHPAQCNGTLPLHPTPSTSTPEFRARAYSQVRCGAVRCGLMGTRGWPQWHLQVIGRVERLGAAARRWAQEEGFPQHISEPEAAESLRTLSMETTVLCAVHTGRPLTGKWPFHFRACP
jgi:hypothetical protein